MFNHVKKARDSGVSLLFLSGNSVDGTQYLAPATDNRPYRTTGRLPERDFKNEQDLMGSSSYGWIWKFHLPATQPLGIQRLGNEKGG
jgi:hypothetical protein